MASIRPFSTTPRPGSAGPGEGLVLAEVRASRRDVRDEHVGVGERRSEAVAAAGAWVVERARIHLGPSGPAMAVRLVEAVAVRWASGRMGRRCFGRTTMGPPIDFPPAL